MCPFYSYVILVMTINSVHLCTSRLEIDSSKSATVTSSTMAVSEPPHPSCPKNASAKLQNCKELNGHCLLEIPGCNQSCIYGEVINTFVQVHGSVLCTGDRNHTRSVHCRFCYQLPETDYVCTTKRYCNSIGTYSKRVYQATCEVRSHVLCLGKRRFFKNRLCHWTNGYSWTTTMVLSVTLGGFGADRFYLGHWKEGIGKLFSFGGFGVWTIIDVILISIGYTSPADGSLYTYRTNYTSESYPTEYEFPFN